MRNKDDHLAEARLWAERMIDPAWGGSPELVHAMAAEAQAHAAIALVEQVRAQTDEIVALAAQVEKVTNALWEVVRTVKFIRA